MRLIGQIKGEEQAYAFTSFLTQEDIECTYDPLKSADEPTFEIWVMHEDDIEMAQHWLQEYQKNPEDPRFETKGHPLDTKGVSAENLQQTEQQKMAALQAQFQRRPRAGFTRLIVLLCVIIYIWNGFQSAHLGKEKSGARFLGLTPLFINLIYDVPLNTPALLKFFEAYPIDSPKEFENLPPEAEAKFKKIEAIPTWTGFYGVILEWPKSREDLKVPMFDKISKGQIWRLFTPVLLHGGFLHILFNMLWLWLLGRQVEERVKKWQYLLMTIIIAIVSNTLQYLMSGPLFVGYSGIVCGLAVFIWMRQRRAPWEGYPLPRSALVFLGVFIVGMLGLQIVSFFLIRFNLANFPMNIANTAHLSGAITGMILGRIPFFSKGNV